MEVFAGIFGFATLNDSTYFCFSNCWSWNQESSYKIKLMHFMPSVICWTLWTARTAFLYDHAQLNPDKAINNVTKMLNVITARKPLKKPTKLFTTTHLSFLHFSNFNIQVTTVFWNKPPPDFYKLNVDGSAKCNSSGGGIIIRDCQGDVVQANTNYYGRTSSLKAEVLALRNGLQLCIESNYNNILVETDSKTLVEMTLCRMKWPLRHQKDLKKICSLFLMHNFQIRHIFREANSVADHLANMGADNKINAAINPSAIEPRLKGLIHLDKNNFSYVRIKL